MPRGIGGAAVRNVVKRLETVFGVAWAKLRVAGSFGSVGTVGGAAVAVLETVWPMPRAYS
jgi:hypothetical protein